MVDQIRFQVSEIFRSIQGESTRAGLPCSFIRLAGCELSCRWCDTEYARGEGNEMALEEVLEQVQDLGLSLVEVTGGEPLLQDGTPELLYRLCEAGNRVLLETGGHRDISNLDPRVMVIMDLKCPSSGEERWNLWDNVHLLRTCDEVKFVIANRPDYEWAKGVLGRYGLPGRCQILFSPVLGEMEPRSLAEWMVEDRVPARFQIQLHKIIWPEKERGV